MLPEEQELERLEAEQSALEEQVATAELLLETAKTETIQFQHRYYQKVGRLYAKLDELDALIAKIQAGASPNDLLVQEHAKVAAEQARASAEEAGLIEAQPEPPTEISQELKTVYRKAAKLIHPDRATTEDERVRRTVLMAQVNVAYERGDQQAIEKLLSEYGQDPEAISGEDVGSRIVKSIRRISQLRRRLAEIQAKTETHCSQEIYQLKLTIEETEAMHVDTLGDLAKQLLQAISEKEINIEMLRQPLSN